MLLIGLLIASAFVVVDPVVWAGAFIGQGLLTGLRLISDAMEVTSLWANVRKGAQARSNANHKRRLEDRRAEQW